MSANNYKSFEFKYSVSKLMVWIVWAAIYCAVVIVVLLFFTRYVDGQNYPWRISTVFGRTTIISNPLWVDIVMYGLVAAIVIGLMLMIEPVGRLIARKRVFLRSTASGFQHNEWNISYLRIPYVKETFISWDGISDAKTKKSLVFGTKIRLTLSEMKKGRNRTHDISTTGSEYDAEYILKTIRMNMSNR